MRIKSWIDLPSVLALAITAICCNYGHSATIFSDNFDSYADTAAMQAVWGAAGAGTLSTTTAYSGSQSMSHPGGADNTHNLAADLIPTDANPVILSGKIYDDGAANKRYSIGFRSLSTFPLFEMGNYNSVSGQSYYARINSFPGGGSPDWVSLGAGSGTEGWHSFRAKFTGSSINISVDLKSDGSIDGSYDFNLLGSYGAAGLGVLRLGGPSSLSSPGGGGYFDDISVDVVPEPTSFLLLGLSGMFALVNLRRSQR
jgi:PEP-CTERM motif